MIDKKLIIRDVLFADAVGIANIYNHYITNTIITFEEEIVPDDGIAARIKEIQLSKLPWFVAEQDSKILGYAYASKWQGRCAYRFSTEVTVYVGPGNVGKGIGFALYSRLIPDLKSLGIHVAVGGIAIPNEASVKFHEKMGFFKVALFKEVGFKFNRWIDVGYWQRML